MSPLDFVRNDRDFGPIVSAIVDRFDHRFSHHHHFMNYFMPRFDLEEDAQFYYLSGEIPGAKVEDVTIEPRDDHTLVIQGTTHSESAGSSAPVQDINHSHENQTPAPTEEHRKVEEVESSDLNGKPASQSHPRSHPGHSTGENGAKNGFEQTGIKILLRERLVGNFFRTFAFPSPIHDEGIQASMENGVLSLLIPKKGVGKDLEKAKRIMIVQKN